MSIIYDLLGPSVCKPNIFLQIIAIVYYLSTIDPHPR